MIYLVLIVLGLSLGSFVNALVWRLYKQSELKESKKDINQKQLEKLSIVHGRSMCMHCKHELAPTDLVPVVSWLYLGGKCRYCKKPIDDTPLAELTLPILFVLSYSVWPYGDVVGGGLPTVVFAVWLVVLTCFVALAIYDAKWFILPDRIVFPLTAFALLLVIARAAGGEGIAYLVFAGLGALTLSGIFWLMWAVSKGSWIGFGDVKLGIALGLLAGTPLLAILVIFLASVFGAIAALPQIITGKRGMKTMLPFGPFLILATLLVFFWGEALYGWYFSLFS